MKQHTFFKHRLTLWGRLVMFLFLASPFAYTLSDYINEHKPFVAIAVNTGVTPQTPKETSNTQDFDRSQLRKVRVRTNDFDALNLRIHPSVAAPVITQIPHKSVAYLVAYDTVKTEIDGKSGRWCRIIYGDYVGWAYGAYLFLMD